jgi:hypothetical protein
MRSQEIFALAGLGQKEILLISASQVARTTGLSHCTQTPGELLNNPYLGPTPRTLIELICTLAKLSYVQKAVNNYLICN